VTVCQVGEICRSCLPNRLGRQGRFEVPPEAVCQDDGLSVDDGAVRHSAANGDALVAGLNFLRGFCSRFAVFLGVFFCSYPASFFSFSIQ
jgi:hypothetical protein